MRFLIFILIVFSAVLVQARKKYPSFLSESECTAFDNTKNFGPIRDQDGLGLCWAFQGAALIEEKICQKNKICGVSVSPIDFARGLELRLDNKNLQGDSGEKQLKDNFFNCDSSPRCDERMKICCHSNGVCAEAFAPYGQFRYSSWFGEADEQYRDLAEGFEDFHFKRLNSCVESNKNQKYMKELQQMRAELVEKINRRSPDILLKGRSAEEVIDGSRGSSTSGFLQSLNISPECKKNRMQIPATTLEIYESARLPNFVVDKMRFKKFLAAATAEKSSMGLSLNLNKLKGDAAVSDSGSHAVVLDGMKFENGQCRIHIRNSWGENENLHGWYDLNDVFPALDRAYFLK